MNSNIPIPGLGQLDPNGIPLTSNTMDDSQTTNVTQADTEMTDAENIRSGSDNQATEPAKETLMPEIAKEGGAEVSIANNAEVQHAGSAAQHDSAEDTKMQDGTSHENTGQIETKSAAAELEERSIETNTSIADSQKQQTIKESPASPRVTDALEAALEGLLGPVAEDTGSKDQVATNDEQSEQQPSNETGQAEGIPIPNIVPAEEDANANAEWEADSSPYQSSSSDSSDDSSDDDESDVEESGLGIEETARLLMEADGGSDDEMDGVRAAKQAAGVRTKNEQPDEPEPRPEIKIDEDDTIVPLGIVQHVVEGTQVVIEALRDGNAVTILDRGTVLCKGDRTVLGVIHDTIATVHKPMYILRFRSQEEAKEVGLERDVQIWYPKSRAKFVFPSQLRLEKGSDASNLHDEEVGPDEMEYSDDEQEQAHKREKKNRKRTKGKTNKGDDNESRGPTTNGDSNLRYDDDDDGPYKPLPRPVNFGTGLPPMPPPGVSPFPATHVPRGGQNHHNNRRGGEFRGRGGRGRGFNGRGRGGHGHNNHHLQAQTQNSHQPPPPFATNQPPVPGQWPFPIPPMPQFGGAAPNPGVPNPSYPMPSWGAAQPNPFPFPPVPPVPNWPNTAQRPPQQANYSPPAGGYNLPPQYPSNGAASPPVPVPVPAPAPAPNSYYPNYYGGGGQAQNGQSQRWG